MLEFGDFLHLQVVKFFTVITLFIEFILLFLKIHLFSFPFLNAGLQFFILL